jgi:hypothetical protein
MVARFSCRRLFSARALSRFAALSRGEERVEAVTKLRAGESLLDSEESFDDELLAAHFVVG